MAQHLNVIATGTTLARLVPTSKSAGERRVTTIWFFNADSATRVFKLWLHDGTTYHQLANESVTSLAKVVLEVDVDLAATFSLWMSTDATATTTEPNTYVRWIG